MREFEGTNTQNDNIFILLSLICVQFFIHWIPLKKIPCDCINCLNAVWVFFMVSSLRNAALCGHILMFVWICSIYHNLLSWFYLKVLWWCPEMSFWFLTKFIRWVSIIGVEMKFGCSSRGLFHFIFIASIKSNQEIGWWRKPQEKFEDTKGIIRSSKSNGQKKNDKQWSRKLKIEQHRHH